MERAAEQTATALASENCPASSMTRTSTRPCMSPRAHSQAVPPTRFAEVLVSASTTSPLEPTTVIFSTPPPSTSSDFCSAGRSTALSRLLMTLCDSAVTPTVSPSSSRARISAAPVVVLPEPGGP